MTTTNDGSRKHDVRVRRFHLAAFAYGACIPLLALAHLLGLMSLFAAVSAVALMLAANAGALLPLP
jgi:energy-converting hydrogenase Eha subunit E